MLPRPQPCKHLGDLLQLGVEPDKPGESVPVYWCNSLQEICSVELKLPRVTCCKECPKYQPENTE